MNNLNLRPMAAGFEYYRSSATRLHTAAASQHDFGALLCQNGSHLKSNATIGAGDNHRFSDLRRNVRFCPGARFAVLPIAVLNALRHFAHSTGTLK